jgi:hypothetical protein
MNGKGKSGKMISAQENSSSLDRIDYKEMIS